MSLDRPVFEVAFVCTGNRFRSPLATSLFTAATDGLPVRVSSAGVLELGPVPPLPEALELARELGTDLDRHRARALTEVDLRAADTVIGFEALHVRAALVDAGARVERTFTLPELVSLLEEVEAAAPATDVVQRARARVAQAHAARPPSPDALVGQIVDPLGRPEREQRRVAEEVHALVARLAQLLFG